jgi:hypothetical protein
MAIEEDYIAQGGVWSQFYSSWEWRNNRGLWHRADGPAVIYSDGHQEWWLHGKWHRVDGPAVIYPNGPRFWYVQGQEITAEVLAWMRDNDVSLPFTKSQQMEFALRWL